MRGPHAANKAEAIRLWNALPREEPWIALPDAMTEQDGDRLRMAIESGLDVAFSDGTITVLSELHRDSRGWYDIVRCADHRYERKVATHYRKHVPPRHPGKR